MGGLVAHVGEKRNNVVVWWGKLKDRDHFEDLGIDRRIILKCILNK
jgi:hypothetical protein